jgi:hypothetical protein
MNNIWPGSLSTRNQTIKLSSHNVTSPDTEVTAFMTEYA